MSNKPEIINMRSVAKSRFFEIEALDLKFSNGQQRTFERFRSQGFKYGAVLIIPILNDKLLLIREYAAGLDNYQLGFPKGVIDVDEKAEQAANRELMEEVGYAAKSLSYLKTIAISPHYMSNKLQFFLAQDLYPQIAQGDEPEPLEVVEWPLRDCEKLLWRDDFSGALNLAALLLLQQQSIL